MTEVTTTFRRCWLIQDYGQVGADNVCWPYMVSLQVPGASGAWKDIRKEDMRVGQVAAATFVRSGCRSYVDVQRVE